jgi:hypothetical protein
MDKQYTCQICSKNYSTPSSLSNHKKIYHNEAEKIKDRYKCRFCDKSYNIYQTRWAHEQKCKNTEKEEPDNIVINENNKLKEERDICLKKIIKLQDKLIKTNRLSQKSFNFLNKFLMERSYTNQSNNTNSLNTVNNNFLQIYSVGSEDIINVLTEQQKNTIMNSKFGALDKLVEITHCGPYNQFKNVIITNLKDEYAYKYDSIKGFFVAVKKNDIIKDIIDYRIYNITEIYDEMENGNKIDAKTKIVLQRFMERCDSDEPFEDTHGIKYPNYKEYKKDCVKILLYNNHEQITKDIASLLDDCEPSTPNL